MSTSNEGEPGRRTPEAAETAHSPLMGRYRRISRLGKGQASIVYLAEDLRMGGRQVAVKMALESPDSARTAAARAHLLNEAQALTMLRHPGVPHLADVLQQGDHCALVLEYLRGRTLQEVAGAAPVPEEQVLTWGIRLCDIVVHLHNQRPPLAHGALQAAHCLLLPGGRIVLFDFGAATRGSSAGRQQDVRALALLLYHLLTGAHQQEEPLPPVRAYTPTVSVATDRALSMALQPAVDALPVTAALLRVHLLQCCAALGLFWGICPYCQATARAESRYCDLCGGTLDNRPRAGAARAAGHGGVALPEMPVEIASPSPPPVWPEDEPSPPSGVAVSGQPGRRARRTASHAQRLRAIGRYIEQQGLRQVTIVDGADGLFVRGQSSDMGQRAAVSPRSSVDVFVGEDELEQLDVQATRHRGTGQLRAGAHHLSGSGPLVMDYEDRLRALGRELDELKTVSHLTLIETSTTLYLDYDRTGVDITGGAGHQHLALSSSDIDQMLAAARARRGTGRSRHTLQDLIQYPPSHAPSPPADYGGRREA